MGKIKNIFFGLIIGVLWLPSARLSLADETAAEINIYYTLSFAMKNGNGEPTYAARLMDGLKETLNQANLKPTFKPTPWGRILRQVPTEKNALVFQIIRTKGREKKFNWIIPLSPKENTISLYTRNDNFLPNLTKQQIIDGPYTAVCRKRAAQCKMLLDFGFPQDRIFEISEGNTGMLELFVIRERADFLARNKQTISKNLSLLSDQADLKFPNYEKPLIVYAYPLTTSLDYLAAPKSIDPNLLIKIKAALKNFKLPTP